MTEEEKKTDKELLIIWNEHTGKYPTNSNAEIKATLKYNQLTIKEKNRIFDLINKNDKYRCKEVK